VRREIACLTTVPLMAALLAPSAKGASLRAERIEQETAAELLIGGPDAVGGVGDWYLANDVIEVIVDDPGRRHGKLNHGGTIVDAGLRDRRGEDQFARLFPVVNMDQRVFLDYDAIRAEVDQDRGWARLVVWSRGGMSSLPRSSGLARLLDVMVPEPEELRDVAVETEYAVLRGEPFVHITTTIRNRDRRPAPIFAYGDVWMRGGRSMRSFVANTLAPERSVGFHHQSFDHAKVATAGDAMVSFTYVSVPGMRQLPPIAYAIFSPERADRGLLNFGVTGQHVTFVNAFSFDPDWEQMSLLRVARATQQEIAPGESWTYRRRLLIAGHPDVASTTDVIFPLLGYADGKSGIYGRVEPADVPCAIHVDALSTGAPVTQILTATDGPEAGRFRAVLPPGEYRLTLRAPQRESRQTEVLVSPGHFTEVTSQRPEDPGWLLFEPAFSDAGAGRVIVEGIGGSPDPVFGPELLDFRIDGLPGKSATETNEIHFAGVDGDPRRVAIPPGHYRLTATRGLEYDLVQIEIEVPGPGRELRVPGFAPPRVIELRGILSADLHVHAQASDDSGMSNRARLRSMLAEGLDVMVTTDHDHLGYFEPALDALGVRDRIHVIQGVEVTSSVPSPAAPWTIGHHNTWPLRYAPRLHRQGAPPSQDLRVADLYALLRRDYGVEVVQLNHPRSGKGQEIDDEAFFTHLGSAGEGFDPARPIQDAPGALLLETAGDGQTRAIDFDAMEVMNGDSYHQYRLVRADWHSLLRQGFRRTGTANSDTHGPDQIAAYPRNYVTLGPGRAEWDPAAFNAAVREGRLFGTSGPLIAAFRVSGGRMGDLVAAPEGIVAVELAVKAAPWVPVDEVRLVVNGEVDRVYRDLPEAGAGKVLRLAERIDLPLERDAFITLEAGAPLDADPATWVAERGGVYSRVVAPGFVAAAFSNPIYVDVDGNGRFDPPGLPPPPERLPPLLSWLLVAGGCALLALALRRRGRDGDRISGAFGARSYRASHRTRDR
jgi:hypothetical protein